ncbi:hypothetical protein CKM354_001175400 [Cercospora kikuchii]|uniref:Linalool dehydratase/isomerase domain-containing protein n=1 Tax=Cercospora kikuchii TaxID=84275 RepID=A0A9P3FL57_9PEZI|nr:uncharacterized protein CKM354_001175400 [Cercospora kikuchii]GIZ48704.1 hypothetical protein CKM354_001175400 [Cercospora kikuchii]
MTMLNLDLTKYPNLNREQLGHIRHFHNLASQLNGDWNHMGSQEPLQEFLDAYRFQIATMAYAAGAAHFHHQPILRSPYKVLFQRLIHKMLNRAVWGYWFNTSLGGTVTDPDLKELRKPWADPVVRENIMYSGHLLLMISMYAMLFDDDEYEKPDSLVFDWNPLFFGLGPERFSYDTTSLQQAILREMERNKYVGVCCEPNMVFVVCNQFPIIAMRYNDVRHGTSVTEELLPKYLAAWEQKGMVGAGSLYPDAWLEKQDITVPAGGLAFTAWANAFMHAWRPEFVENLYEAQAFGYITNFDAEFQLNPTAVANAFRTMVAEEQAPPEKDTLKNAKERAKAAPASPMPYTAPTLGYVAQWLSELGRPELTQLLDFADQHLRPTWEKGGLYYPRRDEQFAHDSRWSHMDPFTGNAAIGYARLNVPNGQKIMWDEPWTTQKLQQRPWIDGLHFGQGVDFVRAIYDEVEKLALLTVKSWDGHKHKIAPVFKNLAGGTWNVYIDGHCVASHDVSEGGEIALEVEVSEVDMDAAVVLSDSHRTETDLESAPLPKHGEANETKL